MLHFIIQTAIDLNHGEAEEEAKYFFIQKIKCKEIRSSGAQWIRKELKMIIAKINIILIIFILFIMIIIIIDYWLNNQFVITVRTIFSVIMRSFASTSGLGSGQLPDWEAIKPYKLFFCNLIVGPEERGSGIEIHFSAIDKLAN